MAVSDQIHAPTALDCWEGPEPVRTVWRSKLIWHLLRMEAQLLACPVLRLATRRKTPLSFTLTAKLIQYAVCLMRGPYNLPKRVLHTVRSSASSFNFRYPLLSLRPLIRYIRLLPRLPVSSSLPLSFLQQSVLESTFYAIYDQTS
jgi:hypothetical protein